MLMKHPLEVVVALLVLWTAVPPSSNPKSKLNQEFETQIESFAVWKKIEDGRVWFQIPDGMLPKKLAELNARSIRLVSMDVKDLGAKSDPRSEIMKSLRRNDQGDSFFALDTWARAGNILKSGESITTFSLSCQKWKSFQFPHWSTTDLCNKVANEMSAAFGWRSVSKSQNPTYKFNILLHESSFVLELVTFVRPMPIDELPKPGFKRVESFMVARAADIRPDEVVLDPMCGRATFLVEAATIWPDATYQGVDLAVDQLENAKENCRAAKVSVNLVNADSRRLDHLGDATVDKIISCPPFGRQFALSDNLYDELIKEWARVLKRTGKMVLLVDIQNIERTVRAVASSSCRVDFIRSPFRLGKIQATVILISRADQLARSMEPKKGEFEWEKGNRKGRALWAQMRSNALDSLVPYSSMRTN